MTEGKLSKKEVLEAMEVCCEYWDLNRENLVVDWQLISFQQAILTEAWIDRYDMQNFPRSLWEALQIVERSYLMFKKEGYYYEGE